jgi:NADH:ubiquinone oxidoreductase subunit 2 (subunit N)
LDADPIKAILFGVYIFSFSGLPFFLGFLIKSLVLYSIVLDFNVGIFLFVSLLNTMASFYILRLSRIGFFENILYIIINRNHYFKKYSFEEYLYIYMYHIFIIFFISFFSFCLLFFYILV